MKRFFENLNYKMQIWMQGRYGFDELSKALVFTSLGCMLVSMLSPSLRLLNTMGMVLLVYAYFRCFSKNYQARNNERQAYERFKEIVNKKIDLTKDKWKYRKTHKYFKCKNCKAVNRVPKGMGNIEITCRVCKSKMRKKT